MPVRGLRPVSPSTQDPFKPVDIERTERPLDSSCVHSLNKAGSVELNATEKLRGTWSGLGFNNYAGKGEDCEMILACKCL